MKTSVRRALATVIALTVMAYPAVSTAAPANERPSRAAGADAERRDDAARNESKSVTFGGIRGDATLIAKDGVARIRMRFTDVETGEIVDGSATAVARRTQAGGVIVTIRDQHGVVVSQSHYRRSDLGPCEDTICIGSTELGPYACSNPVTCFIWGLTVGTFCQPFYEDVCDRLIPTGVVQADCPQGIPGITVASQPIAYRGLAYKVTLMGPAFKSGMLYISDNDGVMKDVAPFKLNGTGYAVVSFTLPNWPSPGGAVVCAQSPGYFGQAPFYIAN